MRELDLRHLRVVCTISDAGSLSRAATQLGLSQPALTSLLHRIEQRVGDKLFSRTNQGVHPTDLGRLVITQARVVLADLANLSQCVSQQLHAIGSAQVSSVRVIGYSGPLLTAFIACLGKELGVRIELTGENSVTAICQKVLDGLDFGLLAAHEEFAAPIPPGLHHQMIVDEPVYVALRADHRLAAASAVGLGDLADEDWIFCPNPDDDGLNQAFFRACAAAGFAPRITHHAEGSALARDLVAAGTVGLFQGIASRADRRVALRPLLGDPIRAQIQLVWRPETTDASRVCDSVREAYRDVLADLPEADRMILDASVRRGTAVRYAPA